MWCEVTQYVCHNLLKMAKTVCYRSKKDAERQNTSRNNRVYKDCCMRPQAIYSVYLVRVGKVSLKYNIFDCIVDLVIV